MLRTRLSKDIVAAILASTAAILLLAPATASAEDCRCYDTTNVLSAVELRALRGGMTVMGVDFDFGAISTVTLDGVPVATTAFTLNDEGALQRDLQIHAPGVVREFEGPGDTSGIAVGGLGNLPGVVVGADGNATVALTGIRPGQIASAVLNAGHDRHIGQRVDVQIVINDFSALKSELVTARGVAGLMSSIRSATAGLTTGK